MKPHESGVESETAMERRKRAEAELTLSALADLMEEQVALMNAENVRLREELAGVKTALGPDYAAWNTTISAAQNVATMRMMLESAEAKLEVAQEGTSAAELLVGPGLCSAQDCGGHCGYVHAVGCEAIREYLADHGGEPYRAPPRAGQAGGEVERLHEALQGDGE